MKVLVPTTLELDVAAPDGAEFVRYDPDRPWSDSASDADALVVWGSPRVRLEEAADALPRLRWVQALAAGPDDVVAAPFPPSVMITSGRGLHDGPVAEHALALLLSAARRLHEMRDAQARATWPGHLGGRRPAGADRGFRTLRGARVTIWGFGSIGRRLAALLQPLGAHVEGAARSGGTRDGVPVHAEEAMPRLLPTTDALVMVLPSSPSTRRVLDAARLRLLPAHAWVVNVGRGDTIDEEALADALERGSLAGASLDVFEQEPLPPDSRLWRLPNVVVSPHAAGGRPTGAGALILRNLKRFLQGRPLENEVARRGP